METQKNLYKYYINKISMKLNLQKNFQTETEVPKTSRRRHSTRFLPVNFYLLKLIALESFKIIAGIDLKNIFLSFSP